MSEPGRELGLEMPVASGLAGMWYPGLADMVAEQGTRNFACRDCWGVRRANMATMDGWNDFITAISGGLLYGRDVPRPNDICPIEQPRHRQKKKRVRSVGTDSRGADTAEDGVVAAGVVAAG